MAYLLWAPFDSVYCEERYLVQIQNGGSLVHSVDARVHPPQEKMRVNRPSPSLNSRSRATRHSLLPECMRSTASHLVRIWGVGLFGTSVHGTAEICARLRSHVVISLIVGVIVVPTITFTICVMLAATIVVSIAYCCYDKWFLWISMVPL